METIEDVLRRTGWGFYHKYLLLITSLSAFTSALSIATITFLLPGAANTLKLTTSIVLTSDAMILIGMSFGATVLGIVSDIYGRKCIITIDIIVLFAINFITGFATGQNMIPACAFAISFTSFANIAALKINFAEAITEKRRGYYMVFIDICIIFGYMFAAGICWSIKADEKNEKIFLISWRFIFGISSSITLIISFLTSAVQINPRNLLAQERDEEAYLVLQNMFAINASEHSSNFRLPREELDDLIESIPFVDEDEFDACYKRIFLVWWQACLIIQKLFSTTYIKVVLLISVIRCTLFGGCLMNTIWLAQSMATNITYWNCSFVSLQRPYYSDITNPCTRATLHVQSMIFYNSIIFILCAILGLMLYIFIVDKYKRRIFLILALLLCGITSIHLGYFCNFYLCYVLAALYIIGLNVSNSSLDIILIESLPTHMRGTAFGATYIPAYILAVFCRIYLDIPCPVGFLLIGIISIAASVPSYFLLDLNQQPMEE